MQPLLLVSVVNNKETEAALQGGADIIDLKNPLEGALGAPYPRVIEEVCQTLNGKGSFSIAIGEFPGKPCAASLAAMGCAFFQPDFIKIAFLPDTPRKEILHTLQEIKLSCCVIRGEKIMQIVSVVFADTLNSAAWSLDDFAALSREGGASGCLIDTWEKNGRSLRDCLNEEEIEGFINSCHDQGLFSGLAGALKFSDILPLKKLKPDLIGVRSAVCGGDRIRGTVSPESVSYLKDLCCRSDY